MIIVITIIILVIIVIIILLNISGWGGSEGGMTNYQVEFKLLAQVHYNNTTTNNTV